MAGHDSSTGAKYRYYRMPPDVGAFAFTGPDWGYQKGDVMVSHFHNCVEIGLCRSGEGTGTIGAHRIWFREGTLCVVPAFCIHSFHTSSDRSRWEWVMLDPKMVIRGTCLQERLQEPASPVWDGSVIDPGEHDDLRRLVELALELFRYAKKPGHKQMIDDVLLSFLCILSSLPSGSPGDMQKPAGQTADITPALHMMQDNCSRDLRVPDLASVCSLSEEQFRRVFRQKMGFPPKEYLNICRISHACEYLLEDTMDIAEIARQCGYPDMSTFHRQFQKQMRDQPRHWREIYRDRIGVNVSSLQEGAQYGIL